MSRNIYLVPDTNVLMQCRQLNELPWKDEFPGIDSITLVLIAPVLREVDRHKGGQGRLAKRARIINRLIGRLLETPVVDLSEGRVPSVTMVSGDEFRPDAGLNGELDYTQADDAIVGTVSALKQAVDFADQQVKLLSNDNGVLLSARRVGVAFHRVPPDWLLPAEADEDRKKLKALEGEIEQLKKSEPACVIEAEATPWRFHCESFEPLSDSESDALLELLKRRCPMETDFGPREISTRSAVPGMMGLAAYVGHEEFVPASENEILSYQEEAYPQWLSTCEEYFKELHQKLERRQPAPRIILRLRNDGARPAEDVRVTFSMRGGGLLIKLPKEEEEPVPLELEGGVKVTVDIRSPDLELPRPPAAPKGFWKKVKAFSSLDHFASLAGSIQRHEPLFSPHLNKLPMMPLAREIDSFYWRVGERPDYPRPSTELTCQQWRHRSSPESFEFEVVWFGSNQPRKGALHVEIHAANLTSPVVAVLPMEVAVEAGDTLMEAKALLEGLSKPSGLTRPLRR